MNIVRHNTTRSFLVALAEARDKGVSELECMDDPPTHSIGFVYGKRWVWKQLGESDWDYGQAVQHRLPIKAIPGSGVADVLERLGFPPGTDFKEIVRTPLGRDRLVRGLDKVSHGR